MGDKLLLANGQTFDGVWRGTKNIPVVGEFVFNTALTGYQEILTDPSYAGQIVVMTYPEIGNYGANSNDTESTSVHASALTRILREEGAMKGTFVADGENLEEAKARVESFDYGATDYSAEVSGKQDLEALGVSAQDRKKVAVLDFGIKSNIIRLISQFADVEIFTLETWKEENLSKYDGFFLSNGPGDPMAVDGAIPVIQGMLEQGKPIFGICLGHQLLSLSLGARTYKLKFGHHGANHPVKNMLKDTVEISSQNHGYAVDGDSFPAEVGAIATHVNMNDGSLAGIMLKDKPVYSIQYHPEACPGPRDSEYLFEKFKADLLGAS